MRNHWEIEPTAGPKAMLVYLDMTCVPRSALYNAALKSGNHSLWHKHTATLPLGSHLISPIFLSDLHSVELSSDVLTQQ